MQFQFFDQINPIFRPVLERPQGYDKIVQEQRKSLQEAEFQRKQEETLNAAKLQQEAAMSIQQRNLELLKRYHQKQSSTLQNQTSSNDLEDEKTLQILQVFTQEHLMKFFQSNLEAPKIETAQKFSQILAEKGALKQFLIEQNIKDRKAAEREGVPAEKLRPISLFKPTEFYGKNIKIFIKDVLSGQQSMGKGFRAVKFDGQAINAKNMKNAEEEDMFG